jgi:hypothetical protein
LEGEEGLVGASSQGEADRQAGMDKVVAEKGEEVDIAPQALDVHHKVQTVVQHIHTGRGLEHEIRPHEESNAAHVE